jgi:hypothetical protein
MQVKWSFLSQNLESESFFFEEWLVLIHNFVYEGGVAIKFNDNIGKYFETKKF